MFEPSMGRLVVDKRSAVAGGHEYVIDGWNPATGQVHMTNSWGAEWGDKGGATLNYDDLAWLLAQGGDAVQPSL
jgi:C1A family cysteine protease